MTSPQAGPAPLPARPVITAGCTQADIPGFGTAAYLPHAMRLAQGAYLQARDPELRAAVRSHLTRSGTPPGPWAAEAGREQLLAILAHDYTRTLQASRLRGGLYRPRPPLAWHAVTPPAGRIAASMHRHTLAATAVVQPMNQQQRRDHGRLLVEELLQTAAGPVPLRHNQAAALLAAIAAPEARDHAWALMTPATRDQHMNLWIQATQLAVPAMRAAPACLLAITGWQCDDPLLAHAALDQALASQPDYQLARVVRGALTGTIRTDLRYPGLSAKAVAGEYARPAARQRPRRMPAPAAGQPRGRPR